MDAAKVRSLKKINSSLFRYRAAVNRGEESKPEYSSRAIKAEPRRRARVLISELLREGPRLAVDIIQELREQGIGIGYIRSAKKDLDVVSIKQQGLFPTKWLWILPMDYCRRYKLPG